MLEQADLFWISTVQSSGRPHVTPLVAVWLDDVIHFARSRSSSLPRGCRADVSPTASRGFLGCGLACAVARWAPDHHGLRVHGRGYVGRALAFGACIPR